VCPSGCDKAAKTAQPHTTVIPSTTALLAATPKPPALFWFLTPLLTLTGTTTPSIAASIEDQVNAVRAIFGDGLFFWQTIFSEENNLMDVYQK
jgi:hypothetical protein